MLDPVDAAIPPAPSARLIRACARATAQLAPLESVVAPLARARPDAPVPADLLRLARRALHAAAPIGQALEAPPLLPLHPPVTHAGLAARLALAAQQAKAFRRRHFVPETPLEAIAWHVEDRALAVAEVRPRQAKPHGEWAGHR